MTDFKMDKGHEIGPYSKAGKDYDPLANIKAYEAERAREVATTAPLLDRVLGAGWTTDLLNDQHYPAGSPKGGQFAPKHGGASTARTSTADASEVPFERASTDALIAGINKLAPDLRGFVSTYTPDEYRKMGGKAYLSKDRQSGFYIKKDGELISVFSNVRGRGDALMTAAVKSGAKKLDCFEDPKNHKLPELYAEHGFRETSRMAWDDQYAPSGWDYDKRDHPPVVFMERSAD